MKNTNKWKTHILTNLNAIKGGGNPWIDNPENNPWVDEDNNGDG